MGLRYALSIALCLAAAGTADAQMAVIVHPSTQVTGVTLDELRRYFLGKASTLGAQRVQIVETRTMRRSFYRSLLDMSEDEVKRRWRALVFRGEAPAPPKEVADGAEARRYVAEHPGAMAFVDASMVDGSVKALTVDGRRPVDAAYPVR